MAVLSEVTRGKKETLREYIHLFTKVVVAIGSIDNGLKSCIFEKGLRLDCIF